ncbi:MAG: lipopolysaccharide assembly protein LapA domain-containing protein [Actinomycetota bacterium]
MADEVPRPSPQKRQLPPARLMVAGIAGVLVLWFAIVNSQRVKVDYIIAERESRLIFVILGSALLGALAGALVRRARRDRHHRDDND